MTSEIDICNRALSRLGTRATIATLSENSTEARTAAIWYAATRDALLRAADWNFARRRVVLALSATPAASAWRFRYALPADCLRLLRIEPEGGLPMAMPPCAFELAGDTGGRVVFSDLERAQAVYVARIGDPSQFDAGFTAALVDQLAAHMAWPLTQKTDVAVRLLQVARLSFAEAASVDAAETARMPAEMLPDWLAVRL